MATFVVIRGSSIVNPAISNVVRGMGAKGWAGSFTNQKLEALAAEWTQVPGARCQVPGNDDRIRVARAIHQEAMDTVPAVALGRFFILTAHRKGLTGLLESTSPYPWNIRWS